MEAHLRQSCDELARSNEALEQFAFVASHDLQEPLRTMEGFAQVLEDQYGDRVDAAGLELMSCIVQAAEQMQAVIDGVLAISRVSTNGADLVPTDMEVVFEEAVAGLRAAINDAGARVTHDSLPVVLADPVQIPRVIQNLLENAMKFRREEAPHVHVTAEPREDRYVFSVIDNGVGIPPEHHKRVFELFARIGLERRVPGTGIGLALCKRIVERHGGQIWFESEPGQGTKFFFTLPASNTKAGAEQQSL